MELHPYFQQEKVVEWHKKNDIGCIAYTPLGQYAWKVIDERHRGVKCIDDEVIKKIAADNDKTPAQIILNWNIQRGVFIIPKTFKIDRLEENFNCFDFKLTEEEYK